MADLLSGSSAEDIRPQSQNNQTRHQHGSRSQYDNRNSSESRNASDFRTPSNPRNRIVHRLRSDGRNQSDFRGRQDDMNESDSRNNQEIKIQLDNRRPVRDSRSQGYNDNNNTGARSRNTGYTNENQHPNATVSPFGDMRNSIYQTSRPPKELPNNFNANSKFLPASRKPRQDKR